MSWLARAPFFFFKLAVSLMTVMIVYLRPHFFVLWRRRGQTIDGVPMRAVYLRPNRSPDYTLITTELSGLPYFDVNGEMGFDRYFKRLGWSREMEVGHRSFDQAVYIRSDSPSLERVLTSHTSLQLLISEIFARSGSWIKYHGHALEIRVAGNQKENSTLLSMIAKLHRELSSVSSQLDPNDDPYVNRARWIRAGLCGIIPFGLLSLAEVSGFSLGPFLNINDVYFEGSIVAVLGLALLGWGVLGALKGSSRGPRILLELSIWLVVTGMCAGIGLFADLDRYFDPKPAMIFERVVSEIKVQSVQRRSGHQEVRYTGCFEPAALSGQANERQAQVAHVDLPRCFPISTYDATNMRQGDGVRIHVGQGLFGLPWVQHIERLER